MLSWFAVGRRQLAALLSAAVGLAGIALGAGLVGLVRSGFVAPAVYLSEIQTQTECLMSDE